MSRGIYYVWENERGNLLSQYEGPESPDTVEIVNRNPRVHTKIIEKPYCECGKRCWNQDLRLMLIWCAHCGLPAPEPRKVA